MHGQQNIKINSLSAYEIFLLCLVLANDEVKLLV
jgi:hypothetical protein